jgi:hypothetical protein
LTEILVKRIHSQLPKMREELAELIEKARAELKNLGDAPPGTEEEMRRAATVSMFNIYTILESASSGQYRDPLFVKVPDLKLVALIRAGPHIDFSEAVAETRPETDEPNGPWSVAELENRIATSRGREIIGFLSYPTFELLVKDAVQGWKAPMSQLLEDMRAIIDNVCKEAIKFASIEGIGAFQNFISEANRVALDVLEIRVEHAATKVIPELIDRELAPFTLNPGFVQTFNTMREAAFEKEAATWVAAKTLDSVLDGNAVLKQGLKWYREVCARRAKRAPCGAWHGVVAPLLVEPQPVLLCCPFTCPHARVAPAQTHSIGEADGANLTHEAREMQMLLEAYWTTACERMVDAVCMALDDALIKIKSLARDISEKFMSKVCTNTNPASLKQLFMEDRRRQEQRETLSAKLKRVEEAQRIIRAHIGQA